MDSAALFISLIFIIIAVLFSMRENWGLERDILYSTGRAFVQLIAAGYLLQYVFDSRNQAVIILILVAMTIIAGYNAGKRGKHLPPYQALCYGHYRDKQCRDPGSALDSWRD